MSKTTFFELNKPGLTDPSAIEEINENSDIIDVEMHRPPLTVNGTTPDASRNIQINTVPLADNLTTDEQQINDGTYIVRTSGGEASIDSGSAFLSSVRGNIVKTGYSPEVCTWTVTNAERPDPDTENINVTAINRTDFRNAVSNTTGTYIFVYSTAWTLNGNEVVPANYGIQIIGTPYTGDTIAVQFVKETRGNISTATPSAFISTGWNLYNHATGRARVCRYSENEGYKISGTYLLIEFATTISGQRSQITPVNGNFNVPGDGWLFVSGGNDTDTAIWATWSDWTDAPEGGYEAYHEDEIDLSGVMVNFPDGLMKVGNVYDEINLNTGIAYARIAKLDYDDYIGEVIASGQPYDTDTDYVYVARRQEAVGNIPAIAVFDATSVDGTYDVNDHGIEYYTLTDVAVLSQSLYGQDLKNKLRRDVLTISEQTLTESQKTQVMEYLGVTGAIETAKTEVISLFNGLILLTNHSGTYTPASNSSKAVTAEMLGISEIEGYTLIGFNSFSSGNKDNVIVAAYAVTSGTVLSVRNLTSTTTTRTAKVSLIWAKNNLVEVQGG